MKIIKQGGSWSRRVTCTGCKTVQEASESDIKYEVTREDAINQQYEDEIEGTYYINCGVCEQYLTIKSKYIPRPIAERIKTNE